MVCKIKIGSTFSNKAITEAYKRSNKKFKLVLYLVWIQNHYAFISIKQKQLLVRSFKTISRIVTGQTLIWFDD